MIPKVIHYCWFGRGEKPKLAQKCIASWKKFCPDYEIIEWNEDNFDVNYSDYTKFTYEHHMYAYLSDYVRLWAIEKYGGFYFDTDVELVKPLASLQSHEAFFSFEGDKYINSGLGFGAYAKHTIVQRMLGAYDKIGMSDLQADYDEFGCLTGSPKMNTKPLQDLGLRQDGTCQNILGAQILSSEYFCPFDDVTGELRLTDKTVGIHWYMKSANSKVARIKSKFSRPVHRMIAKIRKRRVKK